MTTLNRRQFVVGAISLIHSSAAKAQSKPDWLQLGALRWDAWYSPGTAPTDAVARSLSHPAYRHRAPFFAFDCDGGKICLPHITQELLDVEVAQAQHAGLDFWAFVAYGNEDPMSGGLKHFLRSKNRGRLRFCFFTELHRWGSLAGFSNLVGEHISCMNESSYARVWEGRPLYFLGFLTRRVVTERWGSFAGLQAGIGRFREIAMRSGVGDPYIVLAGALSGVDEWALQIHGDAIGSYAMAVNRPAAPFTELAAFVERGWQNLLRFGVPVVPTVMAGWDRRPRVENPVPWEPYQTRGQGLSLYFNRPTPTEFIDHLATAVRFVGDQHPKLQAPAVLIYAWNENDEGGWLVPTRPCDTEMLDAMSNHLKGSSPGTRATCAFQP